MSFKNNIEHSFHYLFNKWGFEFIDLERDYDGNVVVIRSDKLRIRFVNDRADFFLDIGRNEEPEKWIGFYEIIDQLKTNGLVNIEYKHSNKIDVVSRTLDRYFPDIHKFLSDH